MTLDPRYLEYPLRGPRLGHDRFVHRRPPPRGAWPGLGLWIVVPVQHFPMDMPRGPVAIPGGMERPYPSYWDYTQRDYGNRVGIYRIMRALDERGLRATAAVSGCIPGRYPALAADIAARGWEVMAAGWDMGQALHSARPEAEERAIITRTRDALAGAFGAPPRGWHSPSHSQSAVTPDLLAEAGFAWCADWINDDMPFAMTTRAGPLMNLPMAWEFSDRRCLFEQQQTTAQFCCQIADAAARLREEGGRVLTLMLTPWVMGQAHRYRAMFGLLDALMELRPTLLTGEMKAS